MACILSRLLSILALFLACALPARAQPPLVYGFVSWHPVEPGMLVEARFIVDNASAIALQLPPELMQIERATIEPGDIFVPLAVAPWASPGEYTIGARITVDGVGIPVNVPIRVVSAAPPEPSPLQVIYLPVVWR